MENPGLRQRILSASTPEEIEILCKLGMDFEYASERTRSSWSHAARRRLNELNKPDVEVPKITTRTVNKNKPKSNRKQRKNA